MTQGEQPGEVCNSGWAFLLTFAGVGLRINFKEMKKQGIPAIHCGRAGRGGDCGDDTGIEACDGGDVNGRTTVVAVTNGLDVLARSGPALRMIHLIHNGC